MTEESGQGKLYKGFDSDSKMSITLDERKIFRFAAALIIK